MPSVRMKFIPELRERLLADLERQGVSRSMSVSALERWDAGDEPRSPWERGCFAVFEGVQKKIEAVD